MNINIIYDITREMPFGLSIIIYFFLAGISAGSFVLSTLNPVFGLERFKPLEKRGILLALIFGLISPLFIFIDLEQPLRAWWLFVTPNPAAAVSWGPFIVNLYLIICFVYGWNLIKGRAKKAKLFGGIGLFLAFALVTYESLVLAQAKARPLWNTAMTPPLFWIAAMISAVAIMILIIVRSQEDRVLISTLARFLSWLIIVNLCLIGCEMFLLLTSHADSYKVAMLLLTGKMSPLFPYHQYYRATP